MLSIYITKHIRLYTTRYKYVVHTLNFWFPFIKVILRTQPIRVIRMCVCSCVHLVISFLFQVIHHYQIKSDIMQKHGQFDKKQVVWVKPPTFPLVREQWSAQPTESSRGYPKCQSHSCNMHSSYPISFIIQVITVPFSSLLSQEKIINNSCTYVLSLAC